MSVTASTPPEPQPTYDSVRDVEVVYMKERGKPMPGAEHAICQARLVGQFLLWPEHVVLSELNVDLSGKRLVPDICIYEKAQEGAVRNQIWVTEPPQIAVEIISPSQTLEEMSAKIDLLLAGGVPSVWLVIPFAHVISIFQKGAALLSATSGILTDPGTGLSVNVDEVFV
jgi:Uma2 family endonuclease